MPTSPTTPPTILPYPTDRHPKRSGNSNEKDEEEEKYSCACPAKYTVIIIMFSPALTQSHCKRAHVISPHNLLAVSNFSSVTTPNQTSTGGRREIQKAKRYRKLCTESVAGTVGILVVVVVVVVVPKSKMKNPIQATLCGNPSIIPAQARRLGSHLRASSLNRVMPGRGNFGSC